MPIFIINGEWKHDFQIGRPMNFQTPKSIDVLHRFNLWYTVNVDITIIYGSCKEKTGWFTYENGYKIDIIGHYSPLITMN